MTVKLTVMLPEADVATLKTLAASRDITVTAVLRRAIAAEWFIEERLAAGEKILVERDGVMREVVFR